MKLFVNPPTRPLAGQVQIPGSKYHEHRALILASLAEGTSRITGASGAKHVDFTRKLLKDLGTRIVSVDDGVQITGAPYRAPRGTLFAGSSGSTLYFMLGLATLADGPVTFTAQKNLQRRPIGPLLQTLQAFGVRLESEHDRLPVTVYPGRPRGGLVTVSGLLSQWVSGLLMLAPFAISPTVIEIAEEVNERPYLDLTVDLMARFGIGVHVRPDRRRFEIDSGQTPRPVDLSLPPDIGSAAFGMAAAALHPSDVLFRGLPSKDSADVDHPESAFLTVMSRMGLLMEADSSAAGTRIRQDRPLLQPYTVDCRDMPDMLPILATLGCFAEGTSTLAHIDHIRLKESDRVAAMLQLNRMGGHLEVRGDRLLVHGTDSLNGAELSSYNDHRVLMALAVAATRARSGSSITNASAHRLSYPSFIRDLSGIGVPISMGVAVPSRSHPVGPAATPPRESGAEPSIVERLQELADSRPDDLAVADVRRDAEHRFSWNQLNDRACQVAAFLRSVGVGLGDRVAYQLPNWAEFVAITLGVLRVGGVCAPLMPIFRQREQKQMLLQSGAKVLFIPGNLGQRNFPAEIRSIAGLGDISPLEHVVVIASDLGQPAWNELGLRWHDGDQVLTGPHGEVGDSAAAPHLTAQLLFTSGTTGEPKGVLHRHGALDSAAKSQIRRLGLGPDEVVFVPSPLAHQTGFLYGMWLAIVLGAPQVLQAEWDPGLAASAVERHGVTFVQAATPFLADLVDQWEMTTRASAPRTFVVTGASVPRVLVERACAVWRAAVGGAWGSTETCLGTSFAPTDPLHKQWGTAGRAMDNAEIRVTDGQGRRLGPALEGDLEVRGDTLFEGYLNRPELTRTAFTEDGWYRTGDLAVIDDDGYLRITGRTKDVINRGGEKIPVAEVEQLLHEHPSVAETAVVAMPDARLGERACAFVVLKPRSALTFEEMTKFLNARCLAKTYWPERLEVIDALPRNSIGKIQKNLLRDQARMLPPSSFRR